MNMTTPTIDGDAGTWDTILNAAFVKIDDHDHSTGKGVKVTPSGLNINATLSMASNELSNIAKLSFSTIAAPVSGSKNLFVNTADNELYWRSNAGVNVKVTSGSSLNISLVGGIVGDYASVGAEVAYDDANDRYTFKQQSGGAKPWARIASGPIRIFEFNTTETVYVEQIAPGALAASYTVTWPLAVPAAKTLVQCSSAGVLTFENTGIKAITMDTDEHITVVGNGRYKHGDLIKTFHAHGIQSTNDSDSVTRTGGYTLLGGANNYFLPLNGFDVGERIKSIAIDVFGDGSVDCDITFRKMNLGTETVDTTHTVTNQAASWAVSTYNVTDTVVASGDSFELQFSPNAAAFRVGSVSVTYDRP
jgi:hypothetical protein